MIVGKSFYPLSGSFSAISRMTGQLETLQMQLASGKRHAALSEMGDTRLLDLNLRARIGRIEGYGANITTLENRLAFQNTALMRLDQIEEDARKLAVPGAWGDNGVNLATVGKQAETLLREVVDLLNADLAGRYVFSGNAGDTKPVAAYEALMEGTAGRAGFKTVLAERKAADAGADGLGRLALSRAGGTVGLAEDGAHPFGFKIATLTASNPAIATQLSDAASPPRTAEIGFDPVNPPRPGDTVTIGLSYPDDRGRITYVTLTATDADPAPAGSFTVGEGVDAAAGFETALGQEIARLGKTELAAASTYAAADDFLGDPPLRIPAGQTPAAATTLAADPDRTVQWYFGQKSDDPRRTVTAAIDDTTSVASGIQANEHGFVELMKGLMVFAAEPFTPFDADEAGRYEGLVALQRPRLAETNNSIPGSIEGVMMEIGLASHTVKSVKERHLQYDAQLKTMLAGIEEVPIEEVAMGLLSLRTRLDASFQVTAMVSQLNLANYLR